VLACEEMNQYRRPSKGSTRRLAGMDAGLRAWDHISTEVLTSTLAPAPPASAAVCDGCGGLVGINLTGGGGATK
jgi:hypothetical protein